MRDRRHWRDGVVLPAGRRVATAALATIVVAAVPGLAPATTNPAAADPAPLGACTLQWIGPDGGTWTTASNWLDTVTAVNRVPGSADVACLDDGNSNVAITVTVSSS